MINQQPRYRIVKCVTRFKHRDTGMIITTDTVFDLGDVGSFEDSRDEEMIKYGPHVELFFNTNKPPITIQYKYKNFCELYERYLLETGALDNRSQKKTMNYKGMIKSNHAGSKQFFVTTFYPKNHIFRNATEQDHLDAILLNEIRPLS